MGLQRGERDAKFETHKKYYSRISSADVHIIENVTEYEIEKYFKKYFNPPGENHWDLEVARLDPRIFGHGGARPRVFGVIWNRAYIGMWNPDFPFQEVLASLRAKPAMRASDFFYMKINPSSLSSREEFQLNSSWEKLGYVPLVPPDMPEATLSHPLYLLLTPLIVG